MQGVGKEKVHWAQVIEYLVSVERGAVSTKVKANLFLIAHIFGINNTWIKGTVSIARKIRKLCFTF